MPVVRDIQFGLGLQLAFLAMREFIVPANAVGWLLAAVSFGLVTLLWGSRRWPAAIALVSLGTAYAALFTLHWQALGTGAGSALPKLHLPSQLDLLTGLVALAVPQLPLSLANSVLPTYRLATDLFPDRAASIRKLGLTYAMMNLVAPWFGGVPVYHGSGGLAGHHPSGARLGLLVIIYGGLYVVVGLCLSRAFGILVSAFPRAVLAHFLFQFQCRCLAHSRLRRLWISPKWLHRSELHTQ